MFKESSMGEYRFKPKVTLSLVFRFLSAAREEMCGLGVIGAWQGRIGLLSGSRYVFNAIKISQESALLR